jgi:hypothetical protein
MSSTAQKQAEAAQRRKSAAIQARILRNTVAWVDEDYAKRLARQFRAAVTKGNSRAFRNLGTVRKHPSYITEEPIHNGTKVYAFDGCTGCGRMLMQGFNYDERGRMRVKSCERNRRGVHLSPHAQARLFQRLRSNSHVDLLHIVRQLTNLPECTKADIDREITVELPEGRCHIVGANQDPPFWLMKTFIVD